MPRFRCRVSDASGAVSIVYRETKNEESLVGSFSEDGLFLTSYEPERRRGGGRYSGNVVLEFTKMLAILLEGGLSLENALEIAVGALEGSNAQSLARELLEALRKGDSFSTGLEQFGTTFPPVYRGMARIGERTGRLEPMFRRIVDYLDSQKIIKDKLQGALIYPILVLCVVAIGLVGISIVLVPQLRDLFSRMGSELPPQTVFALAAMNALSIAVPVLALLVVIGTIFLRSARRRGNSLSVAIDRIALSLPIAGRYIRLRECLSLSSAMEALVGAGIAVEDALSEARGVLMNAAIARDVEAAREAVLKGETLSKAFARGTDLPREFSRWAAVGERTGSVESIFSQTKTFFRYELDTWATRFMALIEPALVLTVGVILIAIVLFLILPFLTSFTSIG